MPSMALIAFTPARRPLQRNTQLQHEPHQSQGYKTRNAVASLHHEITKPSSIVYPLAFAARRPGKTRGAIGFSLIFCFFCIKAKERAKECIKAKEKAKAPQVSPRIRPPITGQSHHRSDRRQHFPNIKRG